MRSKSLLTLAFLLLAFILFANVVALLNNCFDTYDIGLYFQALVNMANGDLNPYLTVRTLNIFNDHFEPILFLALPSVWLSGGSIFGPLVFEWIVFLSFIYSLVRLNNFKSPLQIIFLCLFSRGLLTALVFPIHPNTWSMIAWLFLVFMIRKRNFWGIIGFSFTLVFFRESNVFALPGIALFYLINKEFRKLWISLAFTSLCLLLIFKIRPYLLGPTYDYGGYFLSGLSSSPLGFVWSKIVSFDIKAFLKVFFPILIPAYFILKKEGRIPLKSPIVLLGMMIAPLLFLHFLAGKIHYHYAVTFIAPLLSYLVLSPKFDEFTQNKKWFYLTLALFFFTSTSTYTKWFKLSVLHKTDKCIISTDKRNSFLELREVIKKEIPLEKSIFSSGRVVPRLMTVGRKYYVPSPFTVHLESYDFLLMEKNFGGEFRSLTKDRYEKMLSLCVDTESQIILNNEFFFLMRGPIGPTCYNYFSFM